MKGYKGVNFNDRELAGEVRTLTLNKIKKVLASEQPKSLYNAVLVRLSGTILPRLNEVTGENGGPLVIELPESIVKKNGIQTG